MIVFLINERIGPQGHLRPLLSPIVSYFVRRRRKAMYSNCNPTSLLLNNTNTGKMEMVEGLRQFFRFSSALF